MVPSPGTQSVATYRSIEFAFAIHGHEESTSNTKYAHHSSFHRGDFQQTYRGDMGIRGTKGRALKERVVSVLRSSKGSHRVWWGSPRPSTAVGGHRTQPRAPRAAPCPMLGPLFF